MQISTRLREHYDVERALASRLRAAGSKEDRRRLYAEVYRQRNERLPHHPLVRQAADPCLRAAATAPQVALLRRFLTPACSFCEIGAGDGAVARRIAPLVGRALALDVTDALALPDERDVGFEFRLFDGFDLGLPDASLDVVYSNDVIEHLHPDDALDQAAAICRALRPGGLYICVSPNRLSGPHDISRHFAETPQGFHLREYTATELADLLRRAGFGRVQLAITVGGRHLSPLLPPALVRGAEALLERLPRYVRRPLARGLAAVKVVAWK